MMFLAMQYDALAKKNCVDKVIEEPCVALNNLVNSSNVVMLCGDWLGL